MISGVLHDTQEMKLKLLELERTVSTLASPRATY
jgi:hypothetical protein